MQIWNHILNFVSSKELKLYIIGENSSNLKELADRYGIDFLECHTIGRAVEMIDREMSDGDISRSISSICKF